MNLELFFDDFKKNITNKSVINFINSGDFVFPDGKKVPVDIKLKGNIFFDLDTYNIVFVNGFFDAGLSSFDLSIKVKNLQEDNINKEIINITKSLDKPVNIIFITFSNEKKKLVILPNIEINIDNNVKVDFIINNLDIMSRKYFENKNFHMNIGKNSEVNFYNYYNGKIGSCLIENNFITVGESSKINIISITNTENILSKKTVFDISKNSEILYNSSFCVTHKGNVSDDILLNHFENDANSNINSYAVAFDSSNVYFKTNVICKKNTKDITTTQVSKILLEGDKATGKIEPLQTISTEKISALHGATISGISNTELFFLESRGIDNQTAKNMIYNSYLQTPLLFIKNEKIYECFASICENILQS